MEPRHKAYPFSVLAHQVGRLRESRTKFSIGRFGLRSLNWLTQASWRSRQQGTSPLWSSGKRSDHAPVPGLWAVEPHLGFGDVGAKFEELLVITEHDAYWLDDDLPHVQRWQRVLQNQVA